MGINYELVCRKELLCHKHSRLKISACVVAEVKNKVCESFVRELCKGYGHLVVGVLAEVLHFHITCLVIKHICCRHTFHWYFATSDCEVLRFLLSVAHHANLHFRVLGTFQAFHRLLVGNALSHERLVVDTYYLVASDNASLLCRSVGDYSLHMYGVLANHELNAHAEERAFQVVGGQLHVLRAYINRMRVELCKYLRHCLFNKRVDVHLVNILVVDDVQKVVEPVATAVYDIQPVAGEPVGKECSHQYSHHHAHRH